jgi:hypothetical protein
VKKLSTIALGVVLIVALGLAAAIVVAQQDGNLLFARTLSGDKLAGGLGFVAGSAAFALILIAGTALLDARRALSNMLGQ